MAGQGLSLSNVYAFETLKRCIMFSFKTSLAFFHFMATVLGVSVGLLKAHWLVSDRPKIAHIPQCSSVLHNSFCKTFSNAEMKAC